MVTTASKGARRLDNLEVVSSLSGTFSFMRLDRITYSFQDFVPKAMSVVGSELAVLTTPEGKKVRKQISDHLGLCATIKLQKQKK